MAKNTKFVIRLPSSDSKLIMPMSVEEAIDSHLAWKQKLISYFSNPKGDLDPEVVSKDNQCALGKWIYSIDDNSKNTLHYLNLKERHKEFHICTGALVQRANQGEDLLGELVLGAGSDYDKISTEVVTALKRLI